MAFDSVQQPLLLHAPGSGDEEGGGGIEWSEREMLGRQEEDESERGRSRGKEERRLLV